MDIHDDTRAADYTARTHGGTSFTGSDIGIYRAVVFASALDLYAKTKMRVNRAYTPTVMLRVASEITGVPFKRGQYAEAARVLRIWYDAAKAAPRKETR